MVVREALEFDRAWLPLLVVEYLKDLAKVDIGVKTDAVSINNCIESVLSQIDSETGAVVIASEDDWGLVGFSAAGQSFLGPAGFSWGETAGAFGTYVAPNFRKGGVAKRMRDKLYVALEKKGFKCLIGGVSVDNHAGVFSLRESGFVPYQISGYRLLGRT